MRVLPSGRYKYISKLEIIKFLLPTVSVVFLIIMILSFYSPWILYRDDSGNKTWFPSPIKFFRINFKTIFSQNIAAMINVIMAQEHIKNSPIPKLEIFVPDNALEELDHKNFFYNLGHFIKRPRIKGSY